MSILVLNCGSSSIKYRLFERTKIEVIAGGVVEKIGEPDPKITHFWNETKVSKNIEVSDHKDALMCIKDLLFNPTVGVFNRTSEVLAVGHRVVHGGERFVNSVIITDEVEKIIEKFSTLAPLHNPPNLAGIKAAKRYFPDISHVAVFDTAFHQSIPKSAFLYAIPYYLYKEYGIRKYGFHGTSHRYVSGRAAELLGKPQNSFTGITCHLGNGCSLTAVRKGCSVDTSMGLTPLEGVPMGTRSGDIDPAVIFQLARKHAMSIKDIDQMLNHSSGLLGISGISNDLRKIQEAAAGGHYRSQIGQEVYAYRIRKYIGAYLATLGGADAIVFTGGVGEKDSTMRKRILKGLEGLGICLDKHRNRVTKGYEAKISTQNSPIKLFVIPTNEELLIAKETLNVALNFE